jgi:Phosphopantetheine attachment site
VAGGLRGWTGIDDNLFDLGGHSLLVTQLIAEVEAVFDCRLAVREIFEAPTVREVAQRISERRGAAAERIAVLVLRVEQATAPTSAVLHGAGRVQP